jgi:AcrR family transcriptional regulator
MTVHPPRVGLPPRSRPAPTDLLDTAAQVLVMDPSAPLAVVAAAAGVGRTTLHKRYPTRDALLVAVAHRALDLCHDAVDSAVSGATGDRDGGLRRLVGALVPVGPQLAYLFRQPSLEKHPELRARTVALDPGLLAVLTAASDAGVVRADLGQWWCLSTLYALVYIAWEGVAIGKLAPDDAPDLVLTTLVRGLGAAT